MSGTSNYFDQFDSKGSGNYFDQFDPGRAEDSDVSRGFKVSTGQLMPTVKGAVGLVGATMENAFGEGGISTGIKNWGLRGFQEGMGKLQPLQRETDSLSHSWEQAKQGNLGALVDWAQYGLGYSLGQLGEAAAMSIVGGLAGGAMAGPGGAAGGAATGAVAKGGVKTLVREGVEKLVEREAASLMEAAAKKGVTLAAEAATTAATKNVARSIGSTVAVTAYGVTQEAGSIYADAEEEAAKRGEKLTGADLARIWGASLAAGGVEAFTDKLGLDALRGKIKLPGVGGRVANGVAGSGLGAMAEGGTEAAQTVIERWGAGQALTGDEATKAYVDAAGLGALGGGAVGGVSGAVHAPPTAAPVALPIVAPEQQFEEAQQKLGQARTVDEMVAAATEMASRPDADLNQTLSGVAEGTRRGLLSESMAKVSQETDKAIAEAQAAAETQRKKAEASVNAPAPFEHLEGPEKAAADAQRVAGLAQRLDQGLTPAAASMDRPTAALPEVAAVPDALAPQTMAPSMPLREDPQRAAVDASVAQTARQGGEAGLQRDQDHESRVAQAARPQEQPAAHNEFPAGERAVPQRQAQQQLAVLRDEYQRSGRDSSRLTVAPHPSGAQVQDDLGRSVPGFVVQDPAPALDAREQANVARMTQQEQAAQGAQQSKDALTERQAKDAAVLDPAPEAGAVIRAFQTPGFQRQAEQQQLLAQARERYTPQDLQILEYAATQPYRLNATQKGRLKELRAAQAPGPVQAGAPVQPELEGPQHPLPVRAQNPELQAAVQARDLGGVASALQASKNPIVAKVGDWASKLAGKTKLVAWPDPEVLKKLKRNHDQAGVRSDEVGGMYFPGADAVAIRPELRERGEVLDSKEGHEMFVAHELAHAQTAWALEKPTREQAGTVEAIKALHAHVKAKLGASHYGTATVHEFVAEGFSNPEFQRELAQIPYGDKSAWTKFVELVARLMGFKDSNALTELLRLGERLGETERTKPVKAAPKNVTTGTEVQPSTDRPHLSTTGKSGDDGSKENNDGLQQPDRPVEDAERDPGERNQAQGRLGATRIRGGDGQPLLVFHGGAVDIERFDFARLGQNQPNPTAHLGAWLTADRAEAARYGSKVSARYLDLRNPLTINVEDLPAFESPAQAKAWRAKVEAQGHDGLFIRVAHLGGSNQFVAFRPEQIVHPRQLAAEWSAEPEAIPTGEATELTPEEAARWFREDSGLDDPGSVLAAKDSSTTLDRYNGRKVDVPVRVADTGETAQIRYDAGEALQQLRERQDVMSKLIKCLAR